MPEAPSGEYSFRRVLYGAKIEWLFIDPCLFVQEVVEQEGSKPQDNQELLALREQVPKLAADKKALEE